MGQAPSHQQETQFAETPERATKAGLLGAAGGDTGRPDLGGRLGNTAKSPSIQQIRGFAAYPSEVEWTLPNAETGEITPFTLRVNSRREAIAKVFKTPQQIRGERFALKSAVHELLPDTRMCRCHRWRQKDSSVKVLLDTEHTKAFLAGLQTCGSVWGCPICAAKISERRRVELAGAIQRAKQLGLQVMLLTLTIPHGLGDDVSDMTDRLNKAWDKTKSTRAGKVVRDAVGIVGTIRASEVTHGLRSQQNNGFHPHLHVLLFIKTNIRPSDVQALFAPLWQDACVKSGLPRPSDRHGCKVDDGSMAALYCSKWGLESEMTKGHHKTGNDDKGMTPFDLLRAYLYDDDQEAGRLFQVYYNAYKGRRQLVWSVGLKKLLAVADLTDEEIAAQQKEGAIQLAELTASQWRAIYKTKSESLILDLAEKYPEQLDDVIKSIEGRYKEKSKGGDPACGEVSFCDDEYGHDKSQNHFKGASDESRLLRQEESQNACGRDMGKQPSNGSCCLNSTRNDVSIGGASDAKPDLVRVGGQGGAGRARGTDLFDLLAGRSYATRKGAG